MSWEFAGDARVRTPRSARNAYCIFDVNEVIRSEAFKERRDWHTRADLRFRLWSRVDDFLAAIYDQLVFAFFLRALRKAAKVVPIELAFGEL